LNVGFDAAISPLFASFTATKKHFRLILGPQIVLQTFLFLSIIPLGLFAQLVLTSLFSVPLLPSATIIILGLITLFEGTKKNLKMILQVAFLSKQVALIEIFTIILYAALVWSWYAITQTVNLMTVMIPMLIISFIDILVLSHYTYQFYLQLPDEESSNKSNIQWQRIIRIRLSNWLHQLSNMLYSSNFLVPFFSMTIGLANAGLFKLISSITYFITTIIHRVFGNASSAVLAHTKECSLEEKQVTFTAMTSTFNQILYGFLIFAAINYRKILTLNGVEDTHVNWAISYLFFFMNIIENFLIAYEKFIAAEEKTGYLVMINLTSIGLLSLIMWQASLLSLLTTLLAFTLVRIIMLIIIGIVSWRHWAIQPGCMPNATSILSFITFSVAFFLMLHL
jgi:hypothetical protein